MGITFKVSTAQFEQDAVVVTRAVVGGEQTIMIVSRLGMDARTAARMASELLSMDERDEFRRQAGLVSATEHPGFDVWPDGPLSNEMIDASQWLDTSAVLP